MSKYVIMNPDEILNYGKFCCESRLLLDSKIAGEPCINVNHCTVRPGRSSGTHDENGKKVGAAHEKAENYVCISGHGDLWLDDVKHEFKPGMLVYIRGGVHHYVDNNSQTEPVCFLTLWPNEQDNEVWHLRKKAWGEDYETRKMPK